MKGILVNSGIALLIFGLINVFIFRYSPFYEQQRTYQAAMDAAIANQAEILLLGDSHMQSLRAADLESTVGNLAFGADGIKEMYAKGLILVNTDSNLKRVLLSTEPQMFNKSTSPNGVFLNKYMFSNPEVRKLYDRSILDLVVDWVPLFNNSYVEFLRNQGLYFIKGIFSNKTEGTKWVDLPVAEKINTARGAGKNDHGHLFEIPADTAQYRNLVELLRNHQMVSYGVNFPVSPAYISELRSEDLTKTKNFVNSLSLHKAVDYTRLFEDLNAFRDPDHLNKEYVRRFADTLEADLEIQLVR